eukprot:m.334061 g.334061  ORF g.334061 m.334061 type:complete len:209 (+) comp55661_c0_seq2:153-779(+)
MSQKWEVFLSHDWGTGHENHKRIVKLNEILKARGVKTWCDNDQLKGGCSDPEAKMLEGVEESCFFVACLTEAYMAKVKADKGNNCKMEFEAAFSHRREFMIPVVCEEKVKSTRPWKGKVGATLNPHLFISLWKDDQLEQAAEELINAMQSRKTADMSIVVAHPKKAVAPIQVESTFDKVTYGTGGDWSDDDDSDWSDSDYSYTSSDEE